MVDGWPSQITALDMNSTRPDHLYMEPYTSVHLSPDFGLPTIEEFYRVSAETAEAVTNARERGGRIIAVGTTVVRALESSVDERGQVIASQGWTDLVITQEWGVRAVDGLPTGFHEPRASHLAMLEAFAGRDHLARAYWAALDAGYLCHEFGDLNLIL